MTSTTTQCREIQACYESRGLEKGRHMIWHREVQAWDDKEIGTGLGTGNPVP